MKHTLAVAASTFAALAGLLIAACGSETPPPKAPEVIPSAAQPPASSSVAEAPKPLEEPPPPPKQQEQPPPPPPKKKASEVIVPGSVWMLSLADSPDAKKALEDKCAKSAGKDEKKKAACIKAGEEAAATEGWRVEKDKDGKLWWVSFGSEKGKEVIYNKMIGNLTKDTEVPGKASYKPEGKDLGTRAMKKLPESVDIELSDESTFSMTDPTRGKLVYKLKK